MIPTPVPNPEFELALIQISKYQSAHKSFGSMMRTMIRKYCAMPAATPPRRIRAFTFDVTGTLVSFVGRLGAHYADCARRCGVHIDPGHLAALEKGFQLAYNETHAAYPCFGGNCISTKDWWRTCVLRSFEVARELELNDGLKNDDAVPRLTEDQKERVFKRIYAQFGSHSTYSAFDDAIPFLRFAKRHGVITGIISNADERYGDSILPMLDIFPDFFIGSKDIGCAKPDRAIFDAAIAEASSCIFCNGDDSSRPIQPNEILHLGNDFEKDFIGARNAKMHAILLDRFGGDNYGDSFSEEGQQWSDAGAPVAKDLLDVIDMLARQNVEFGKPT